MKVNSFIPVIAQIMLFTFKTSYSFNSLKDSDSLYKFLKLVYVGTYVTTQKQPTYLSFSA